MYVKKLQQLKRKPCEAASFDGKMLNRLHKGTRERTSQKSEKRLKIFSLIWNVFGEPPLPSPPLPSPPVSSRPFPSLLFSLLFFLFFFLKKRWAKRKGRLAASDLIILSFVHSVLGGSYVVSYGICCIEAHNNI